MVSLVNDIQAGDRNVANLFYGVYYQRHLQKINKGSLSVNYMTISLSPTYSNLLTQMSNYSYFTLMHMSLKGQDYMIAEPGFSFIQPILDLGKSFSRI